MDPPSPNGLSPETASSSRQRTRGTERQSTVTQAIRNTFSSRPASTLGALPIPLPLPQNPATRRGGRATRLPKSNELNIFCFTSHGSMMISCPSDATIEWILARATHRFSQRGLTQPLVYARAEDGSVLEFEELISVKCADHPVIHSLSRL